MNIKIHNNNHFLVLPLLLIIILTIASLTANAQNRSLDNLNVSAEHPRLFFNDETLAKAKEWFEDHPFEPRAGEYGIFNSRYAVDAALFNLLAKGVRTDSERNLYAQKAISWAKLALADMDAVDYRDGQNTCNECRWYMEQTLLILDWCDDALSDDDRELFYGTLDSLIPMWNGANWGNPESPRSNFNHGYWRQSVTYGLLIYNENKSLAVELLENGINQRFKNFKEYASTGGISGIPSEGASYNYAMLSYQILVAGISMANAGYDYVRDTKFYERAYMHTIYNITPDKTYIGPNATHASYLPFPYGDGGAFMNTNDWGEVLGEGHANSMLAASLLWSGVGKLSEYYRGWVDKYGFFEHNYPPKKYLESVTYDLPSADMAELPLDYFGPGGGHTPYGYTRTSWDKDAAALSVQLGKAPGGGHEHFDAGTFTLVKGNRFLIVPPTGRGYGSGWMVPDYDNNLAVNVESSISKNTILFGKEGSPSRGYTIDSVDRLMTHQDFFYAANDITPAYINIDNPTDPNFTNEHIENFVRETVFIRPLETVVIFDRTESKKGQDFTKTSLLHVQGEPIRHSERKYSTVNGDYEAIIDILLPRTLDITVIDETSVNGCDFCAPRSMDVPHRLQMESTGEKKVYFMNVIQAKGAKAKALDVVELQETENTFLLTLSHPTKGHAVVEFEKGQKSKNGRIGYDANKIPDEMISFPEKAQVIDVTEDGPVWYEVGTSPISNTPEVVTTVPGEELHDFQFSVSDGQLHLVLGSVVNQVGELKIYTTSGAMIHKSGLDVRDERASMTLPKLAENTVYIFDVRTQDRNKKFKMILK
ncbi:MAG: hypothetical protein ABJF11_18640 [Reichenbachiella sp.]|uniref:hypothetical protein n=1 Tax=Reichenbachiella sp. TaxID=2184521 RepID=UPI0032679062